MQPVIVLLAPSGQVGFELARSLPLLGQVHTLSRTDVDFSNTQAIAQKVRALAPTIIVNAAAYTAVDAAEQHSQAAYLLNTQLPAALAQIAKLNNAWLVHYSTDYVYPGTGTNAWQETDDTAPLSVYGASKLAGDMAITAVCSKYLIFRTSWVYAARGNNFMLTMLRLAQQRTELNIVCDQIGAPTPARLIAQVTTLALWQALQQGTALSGIYNLASQGEVSWYQFASTIISLAKEATLPITVNTINPISTAAYPTLASRPLNSRLNPAKIQNKFAIKLPCWHSQLALTFNEWLYQQP